MKLYIAEIVSLGKNTPCIIYDEIFIRIYVFPYTGTFPSKNDIFQRKILFGVLSKKMGSFGQFSFNVFKICSIFL